MEHINRFRNLSSVLIIRLAHIDFRIDCWQWLPVF